MNIEKPCFYLNYGTSWTDGSQGEIEIEIENKRQKEEVLLVFQTERVINVTII